MRTAGAVDRPPDDGQRRVLDCTDDRVPKHATGIAHSMPTSGAPTAISGAATTISSSCCTMCAASHCSLHSSSGGDSATTSASHPSANASASNGRTPRP